MNEIREIKDDEHVDIVLCGPAATAARPGGKLYKCSKCGEPCACSLGGTKMIEDGAKPFCFECGLALVRDNKSEFVYSGQSFKAALEFLKQIDNN